MKALRAASVLLASAAGLAGLGAGQASAAEHDPFVIPEEIPVVGHQVHRVTAQAEHTLGIHIDANTIPGPLDEGGGGLIEG